MKPDPQHQFRREPQEWLSSSPAEHPLEAIVPLLSVVIRAVAGVLGGAAAGMFLVGIGFLRAGIAAVAGHVSFSDFDTMWYYVGGWAVAGGLVGVLAPFGRRPIVRYLLALMGTAVVFTAIGIGVDGPISQSGRDTSFATAICTVLFGVFLGYKSKAFFDPGSSDRLRA